MGSDDSRVPSAPVSAPRRGVSARALIIGFLLTPVNVFFIVKALWVWASVTGAESLFTNTIGLLFLLAVGNQWLKRRRPEWAFSSGEMLTIYLMLGIGTGLTCSLWDLGGAISTYVTHAFWFATDQNEWRETLWPYLPTWLTVQDREVLAGFYEGDTTGYQLWILRAWAAPAFWWTCLVASIMWVCLCMNSIVRRRWADEEKLAFPMAVLPTQLADERFDLLKSKLFWIGVGVAAGIGAWNLLASIVPALPAVPLSLDFTNAVEHKRPWDFLRYRALLLSPWYLGLSYLIPLDLTFSLFAFGTLWSAEYVVSGHLGWCTNKWSGFPYGEQQTAGGFIALAVVAMWLDREFLAQVLRRALGLRASLPEESGEAFGYRTAVLGVVGGLAFLWWVLSRAELPQWVALAFLGHYFLMAMVICRLRAQLGAPSHQLYGAMPNWVLPTLAGSRNLGPRSMGLFYLLRPLLQEQRNHPAPLQIEGFKMAEGGRMERRRLAVAMAIVPVLAIAFYFWATIHFGYDMGMTSGHTHVYHMLIGQWATSELDTTLKNPTAPNVSGTLAMALSAGITTALYFLKLRFTWWPLHPVAYPIAMSNTIAAMGPVLFLAWLIKGLLLRYGGLRAHRTALPFFLGLIAGDAVRSFLVTVFAELLGSTGWDPNAAG